MKLLERVVVGAVTLWTLALCALITYWLAAPYKVLDHFSSNPRKVLTQVVHVGDMVIFQTPSCKLLDVPGTVSRRFVDGVVYQTPSVPTSAGQKCNGSLVNIPVHVPNIPPGVYHLEAELRYKVNPLREVVYRFSTENFRVIKQDDYQEEAQ